MGTEKTYVWAVPYRGEVAFAAAEIGRKDLTRTVARLRVALEPKAATIGEIPDFDLAAAYGLYEKLLKPVEAGWRDATNLLVVTHGPLGYLPLSVLLTAPAKLGPVDGALFANYRNVPWLARSHSVTVLPAVASLRTVRGLPPGDAGRKAFVGFADPYFSAEQLAQASIRKCQPPATGSLAGRGLNVRGLSVCLRAAPDTSKFDSAQLAKLPRLPDTAEEVRAIASALDADLTTDVFLGKDANEEAVKTMDLSAVKVIAFATHGLVPGDLDGLTQPALALSAPDVAGTSGDGLLTMGEILGLKLNADWIVLSACNTGSGEGAGAEAVSGLGRAFFYAGSRALLVSNWPVHSEATKDLMTDLFRRQARDPTLGRAAALRQAMLFLVDSRGFREARGPRPRGIRVEGLDKSGLQGAEGRLVFSYAHPIFWAPFSLVGDPGGGPSPIN